MLFPLYVYSPSTVIVTVSSGVKSYVETPSQLNVLDGAKPVINVLDGLESVKLPAICGIPRATVAKDSHNNGASIVLPEVLNVQNVCNLLLLTKDTITAEFKECRSRHGRCSRCSECVLRLLICERATNVVEAQNMSNESCCQRLDQSRGEHKQSWRRLWVSIQTQVEVFPGSKLLGSFIGRVVNPYQPQDLARATTTRRFEATRRAKHALINIQDNAPGRLRLVAHHGGTWHPCQQKTNQTATHHSLNWG